MPPQSTINAYRIEIKNKHSRDLPWMFKSPDKASSAFGELRSYFEDRAQSYSLFGGSQLLRVENLAVDVKKCRIDGLLHRGRSGTEQRVVDVHTKKESYRTKRTEAVLAPLYFCLRLESGRRFGIALLEERGTSGVKSLLKADMTEFYDKRDDKLTIAFSQLVDASAIEKLAALGVMTDVILINRGESATSRSALSSTSVGGDALDGHGDRIEMHLKKHGGWKRKALDKMLRAAKLRKGPGELIKAPSMGEVDEVRVAVKIGSRRQVFSMINAQETPLRFVIADELVEGKNGFPTLESLRRAANSVYTKSIDPVL